MNSTSTLVVVVFFVFFVLMFFLDMKQVSIAKNYMKVASAFDELPEKEQIVVVNNETSKDKILVLYTGPSNKQARKRELYERNFEFFLDHGVDCERQDTVIIVGHDYYDEYIDRMEALDSQCQNHGHKVILMTRRDLCYDMESLHMLFFGSVPDVNVEKYDYFFNINCGVSGPGVPAGSHKPWTSYFTELLDDTVKMTGLSLNCERRTESHGTAHIQSMMFALDREGVQLVKESEAIFDCYKVKDHPDMKNYIINRYERKMSPYIINKGYGIRSYAQRNFTLTADNRQNCTYWDMWLTHRLNETYGYIPPLEEFIFYKSSRVLTEDLAKKIKHSWPKKWHDWRP